MARKQPLVSSVSVFAILLVVIAHQVRRKVPGFGVESFGAAIPSRQATESCARNMQVGDGTCIDNGVDVVKMAHGCDYLSFDPRLSDDHSCPIHAPTGCKLQLIICPLPYTG
jgi:hypothetical protein